MNEMYKKNELKKKELQEKWGIKILKGTKRTTNKYYCLNVFIFLLFRLSLSLSLSFVSLSLSLSLSIYLYIYIYIYIYI